MSGQIILCCRGCSMCGMVFSGIYDFYLPNAISTLPHHRYNKKVIAKPWQVASAGQKLHLLRTTDIETWSEYKFMASSQAYWLRISGIGVSHLYFNKLSKWFLYTLKLVSHFGTIFRMTCITMRYYCHGSILTAFFMFSM